MAPGKRKGFGGGRGKQKRKKYNLMTIRQRKDYQEFGEAHPVESQDNVKRYTKVEDTADVLQSKGESSSDESEEEVPVIKQLFAEIGVQEEQPESEQEDDDSDDDSDDDGDDHSDGIIGGEKEVESEEENTWIEEGGENADPLEEGFPENVDDKMDGEIADDEEHGTPDGYESSSDRIEDADTAVECDDYEVESEEEDNSENDLELSLKDSDCFTKHFEADRDISHIAENAAMKWKKKGFKLPGVGESVLMYKDADFLPDAEASTDLQKMHVKLKLCSQVSITNSHFAGIDTKGKGSLSRLQQNLFNVINTYQDLFYPKQTMEKLEEMRLVYCLHAVNHVLKTRSRVIAHNTKLKIKGDDVDDDTEYRDQGLTRPKVLILLPYRDRALKVVNMLISLLSQQVNVANQKRFEKEFSELEESNLAQKTYKPDDFKKMFEGNTDDNFRVGMTVAKKSLRLYSHFYESDIIVASPLGLRTVIGLEGDKERDYDFLSSIEILIVDQADVYLMQNWDYLSLVFKHLHLQPKESHGVDFSRVRMWAINGWSKHYRQTVILSSCLLPEMLTLFNKWCHNYAGKVLVQRGDQTGSIGSSVSDCPQIFHRITCETPDGLAQRKAKFEYFKKKILPYHTSAGMKQTLIYCNYFSFVMLRNYFREAEVDFLFMNEYDTERHVRNCRIHFRKRHPHFMLYTERLHFHYRFRLRGIHHLLWFDLPQYPAFYPELVNLMEMSRQACTSTALFTRYEGQKLMEIVGGKQAAHLMGSEKPVNMITIS